MIDFFFQMGLSNALLSLALGIVAMVVGAKARHPGLAHLLWLLVFIKLLTPPIVMIPIVTIPAQGKTAVAINENSRPGQLLSTNSRQLNIEASQWSKLESAAWNHARVLLPPIWLLGSVVVFAFSIVRVCRFSRLLAAKSEAARQDLQTIVVEIAHRLGLNKIPTILTTSASISPMVWWAGGKVRIIIPTALLDRMDAQQWKWIVAHELAHVRRRDYLVRWLEWLACVCFWWNPVVWWAQRNLRAAEEICCDEMVISCLNPKPKFYANSLLSAVEFLARPVLRPPAMASEINSGGFLERRFKMIVSNKPKKSNTRWQQGIVLLCAVVVLPLGIASAADYEAVGRRLRAAVAAGELTGEEARAMLGALRRTAQQDERRGERGERRISREDYARAEAELDKAVAAGRISEEDAKARLNGMRRMMAGQSERGQRGITIEEYKRAEAKMRKMIEDGKAKPEDVERRLIEMRKMIGDQSKRGGERQRTTRGDKRTEYEGFERRIKAAVRQGKMTREEAGEKLKGFRRRMEMAKQAERGERSITRKDYARVEAELDKAIAEGRISEEDAKARLNGMRREMAKQAEHGERSITVEEYKRAEAKMRKMIEDGKAKPEDVERRLIEMRKMIGDQSKRGGERGNRERPDWEGIKRRIEAAVKSGDMTREEADAKYKTIRERMAGRSKR